MRPPSAVAFAFLLLAGATTTAQTSGLIPSVRQDIARQDFAGAERRIRDYRAQHGAQPEMIEALSWLGRGALAADNYDAAARYAEETGSLVDVWLKPASGQAPGTPQRKLDADAHIAIAQGAALEVQAQVLAARNRRSEAVSLLQSAIARWRGTSIVARLRKNLNVLTLEGRPAPALRVTEWIGANQPAPLAALAGKPVLLFFWAHWCSDCKSEAPILARLAKEYASRGLTIVGPTRLYGYAAAGEDAAPDVEKRYIDAIRRQFYSELPAMTVPLSEAAFTRYGASTTPTLVLIDRRGIVRLYHPGAMSYDELAARIAHSVAPRALPQ